MGAFPTAIVEISGKCTGRCFWCARGRPGAATAASRFMPLGEFEALLDSLLRRGLLDADSQVHLYNWGDPLLHPELGAILDALATQRMGYVLSTNASKPLQRWEPAWAEGLRGLKFSMPGFSQRSYDRIHKLSFEAVTANIRATVEGLRVAGLGPEELAEKVFVEFHVYQFNLDEIEACRAMCRELGIRYTQVVAFINDLERAYAYLTGSLDYESLRTAGQHLFLHYVEELVASMPSGYVCPQYDLLVVDEYLNAMTCCGLYKGDEDYALGPVMELGRADIDRLRRAKPVCKRCLGSGLAWWGHNPRTAP